ncbi:hypothetical protein BDQ17DRAFT_1387206 [Cyathus striatus]|nr:hypothetical protein BDQ17DRAFT_1387206 [Cyathus striatus]
MPNPEDNFPTQYKYSWSKNSELPLDDFLTKFKPSMVQNDGTKPWIWVRQGEPSKEDQNVDEAIIEAAELLNEITEKVENIKNDASIPVRSNKKTGAKSKKELREEVQTQATQQLKAIAIKHGYVSGKWLIFAPADKVDAAWRSIASSLISGPLSSTAAYLAKVATSPAQESPNYQHIICIYMPDVYDKESITEVMRVLLRHHGATLSGVKSNLYTSIGIDSKHASGIQSTTWKNTALMEDSKIKELKDEFFAELGSKSEATAKPQSSVADKADPEDKLSNMTKRKLKLKKKSNDDPFASNEEDSEEKSPKPKQKMAKANKATLKRDADDESPKQAKKATTSKPKFKTALSDDDSDSEAERRTTLAAKKRKSVRTVKETSKDDNDDNEDNDNERPKKRRAIKK